MLLDETAQRDAIHVALAPVVAAHILSPGEHVGFIDDDDRGRRVGRVGGDKLGIVDPYLTANVMPGQRFWLFLYPQTVTSLRHDWTHPAFTTAEPTTLEADSRTWIESFAAELDQTYNRLMDAARTWIVTADYTYDNSERYKDVDYAKWPIFWKHYEIVTGTKVNDHDATIFTCSC